MANHGIGSDRDTVTNPRPRFRTGFTTPGVAMGRQRIPASGGGGKKSPYKLGSSGNNSNNQYMYTYIMVIILVIYLII